VIFCASLAGMRSEETQILGAQPNLLPISIAVPREHSLLGRPANAAQSEEGDKGTSLRAFERGLTTIRDSAGGLSALLFSTRTVVLTRELKAAESLDYLSGLLIGEEICAARPTAEQQLARLRRKTLTGVCSGAALGCSQALATKCNLGPGHENSSHRRVWVYRLGSGTASRGLRT
jgi:2-keto-3-deoxy-galactonokinase